MGVMVSASYCPYILFIFCMNVDIDELLLLDKNKDLGVNFL